MVKLTISWNFGVYLKIISTTGTSQRAIKDAAAAEKFSYHFVKTIRKQWACNDNSCEESVTTCRNKICDTTKNNFKAENYRPEIPKTETPPVELLNISEIFDFSQFPLVSIPSPFENSGLIDLVANARNFTYYWSNSKHINKKCHNNACKVTTRTCTNGKCEEKITSEVF